MKRHYGVVVLLAVFAGSGLGGCIYPKAAEPPSPLTAPEIETLNARFPEATSSSFAAGRDLFIANCGVCHDPPDVMLIDDGRWPGIVKRMGEKAELDKAQSDSVLEFILAVRAARHQDSASK